MGIGADSDNLAAQLLEPAEIVCGGKVSAAAVQAAGVQLQSLAFFRQSAQNLINQLPVLVVGNGTGAGIRHGFSDIGQVCQHVVVGVYLYTGQGFLQTPAFRLKHGLTLPEGRHVHIQPVHEMNGAEDEVEVPTPEISAELLLIVPGQAEFHTPPDFQSRHLKRVIFRTVLVGIKGHVAHGSKGIIVDVIRKADLLEPRVQRGLCHGKPGVVPVKGHPGVHMVVVHFYLSQNWRNAVGSAACKLISSSVNQ